MHVVANLLLIPSRGSHTSNESTTLIHPYASNELGDVIRFIGLHDRTKTSTNQHVEKSLVRRAYMELMSMHISSGHALIRTRFMYDSY